MKFLKTLFVFISLFFVLVNGQATGFTSSPLSFKNVTVNKSQKTLVDYNFEETQDYEVEVIEDDESSSFAYDVKIVFSYNTTSTSSVIKRNYQISKYRYCFDHSGISPPRFS